MNPVVVALGNFDGVHLGHQAVLRRAVEEARKRETRVVAATFDPHPRSVLVPGARLGLLTTVELRREALLRYGADEARVIRFDLALSKKSPREFVDEVLVGEIGAGVVVVGENFRFGHKAAGDVEDLASLMRERGGEAHAVPIKSEDGGSAISSTRIRELLAAGDVREAGMLLGRPFVIRGLVTKGDERGRSIGYPTANVVPDPVQIVPARGVYAGHVKVEDQWHPACTNVGLAPTFGRNEEKVEAHILDFDGGLYGRVLDVSFVERIRAEKRFSGIEELVEQIGRDVREARRIIRGTA